MDPLLRALDSRGEPALFWLRDDDAVKPTAALDRLLSLGSGSVPMTVAAIPAATDEELAARLAREAQVTVAVHGWSHQNHATEGKKQELGGHRPTEVVLGELAKGFTRLKTLHGPQFLPMLVPPWNRIDASVVAGLPALGFEALSVFGTEKPAPIRMVNTHVDLIDWHGTRGGRPDTELVSEITRRLEQDRVVGILTHHLVHDATAWRFLDRLFSATADHPGCRWVSARALI